ncbi:MAG: J domain-containing protein [Dehalococcoidia bacterium]
MAKRDYYGILGISRSASDKEIKKAFRQLARKHHPDVNPGDRNAEAKFKEINEAYQVLSDPETRKQYDRYGKDWKHAEQFAQAEAAAASPFSWRWDRRASPGRVRVETVFEDDQDPFGGIFETFFGGRRATGFAPPQRRGRDFEQPVEITLEEAFQGATRLLRLTSDSGASRRLEVKIPAGVKTGSRVRIAGEGGPGGGGGPNGDLYLVVTVLPHARFDRTGYDLHTELPVPLVDAMLGGEANVPTLDGKRIVLKIPPETQNGKTFRLANRGMTKLNGKGHGHLYVKVRVVLPEKLSQRERELFRDLQDLRK